MGKTNAEYCKNYYNRKKAAEEGEKIRQGLSVKKPIKKTGAERTRAYRLRKIMLSQINESSVTEISSIPSTANSRITTFEPSFQLATTSASTNRPDISTVSSTGIADHDGDNLHDSFLSTPTHDNRNSIIVQAEVHMANSPVLYDHSTSENTPLADMEQNLLLQAQETIHQLADAPNVHTLSTQDIVRDQEHDLLNQDTILDKELPPPDGQAIHSNSPEQFINIPIDEQIDINVDTSLPYSNFRKLKRAHQEFKIKFLDNSFGYPCSVCDRLWFQDDLKRPSPEHKEILIKIIPKIPAKNTKLCNTCVQALNMKNIPLMSTFNGFKYPDIPQHLPPLDLVSERLISPRIPFMQIRRLRHVNGQYGIFGQIINVPVSVNNMVKSLPRNVDDDYCINVHIKRKKIHRSSYLQGIVNKRTIKSWLQVLIPSPLYTMYDIKVDESFFNDNQIHDEIQQDDFSEHIPIEESFTAQQQTLLWNEEQYLRIAPGEDNVPESLLL